MIWAVVLYLGVAYWLFWVSLLDEDAEPSMHLLRAVIYLAFGPLLLAVIFALGALADLVERHGHWRAVQCSFRQREDDVNG